MNSLDMALYAFEMVIGFPGKEFGRSTSDWIGCSDNVDGVQWNLAVRKADGAARLGVNLEGMAYKNTWPITQFIESELESPDFINVSGDFRSDEILIGFTRDAWQAATRRRIEETYLGGSERYFSELDEDGWRMMLNEAYNCLNSNAGYRGRAKQRVTLDNGKVQEMPVTPHLTVYSFVWNTPPNTQEQAVELLRSKFIHLIPFYEYLSCKASPFM